MTAIWLGDHWGTAGEPDSDSQEAAYQQSLIDAQAAEQLRLANQANAAQQAQIAERQRLHDWAYGQQNPFPQRLPANQNWLTNGFLNIQSQPNPAAGGLSNIQNSTNQTQLRGLLGGAAPQQGGLLGMANYWNQQAQGGQKQGG